MGYTELLAASSGKKKNATQDQKIRGKKMVSNSFGNFVFELDNWSRLDRMIILGSDTNQYYATAKELTKQNCENAIKCIKEDGVRVVNRLVEISQSGRAPKNDHAVFLLALAAAEGNANTKSAAYQALPKIARTGTHLMGFCSASNEMRGWGTGLRKAVANWYLGKDINKLCYTLAKYQQRDGWSNRDLLRLSHPKTDDMAVNTAFKWALGQTDLNLKLDGLEYLLGVEKAKKAASVSEIVSLIEKYGLVRESIPTEFLNEKEVWGALLEKMPLNAMIRNLSNMTKCGLITPLSSAQKKIVNELGNQEKITNSRMHPINILIGLKTYASGHGFKGSSSWTPNQTIVTALDEAFYLAFKNVEPTGQNIMLALDVSGSMGGATIANSNLTAREATAAIALVTMNVEKNCYVNGFSSGFVELKLNKKMRLDEACYYMSRLPFDYTDCAVPMAYALRNNLDVDLFCTITDNETNAGGRSLQPAESLKNYRNKLNKEAKMVIVGTTATSFSVGDSTDKGTLNIVGFDSATPQIISDFAIGNL